MVYTSEIEKLERRWAENPKGRNFAPLADAYRKAGELDRAIELCQNGLALHPDYVSAHIVFGRCMIDQKNDPAAADVFRKVLGLDPENIIALKILGEIAERNGRFDEAVEWLGRLLNADPMNGDAAEALSRAKRKAAPARPTEPVAKSRAEAPTAAMTKPGFVVEHLSDQGEGKPALTARKPSPDVETFDGSLDFNAAAHAAAKADGLEVQEDVELSSQQFEQVEVEGLAPTHYEGSGLFKLDKPASPEAAPAAPEPLDEPTSPVDLPLIMPDDVRSAGARTSARAAPPRPPAPPPPPPPPPPPQPAAAAAPAPSARTSIPAAVTSSDDDGAADTATLSQVEPVLTETMAELYLKQGHQHDALRVYQALLAQRPGDARLRVKVEQLSPGRRKRSGISAQAFLKSVLSGRGAPAAARPPVAPTTLDAAFDTAAGGDDAGREGEGGPMPGAPTRPASDHISLDAVFGGEESARQAAGGGANPDFPTGSGAGEAGDGGSFSFDQFFGSAQGSAPGSGAAPAVGGAEAAGTGPRTSGRTSGRTQRPAENEGELDQFQQWLKKLKS
ncbi:MAG TPA: tetratricopeptide repeat protein [Gemmatimonadales bacterium]|nr:tetratricopeptide repeat protein [Gemmatimonadales bacterium]